MTPLLTQSQKLYVVLAVSSSFFIAEISVGFYTHSLALIADAFHYLNDLLTYLVALVAQKASERDHAPPELSFGWQRARLLGSFFNGVFLLALGISIFLQALERFITPEEVQNPKLVMILGAVGFGLNLICISFFHEHHDHGDLQIAAGSNIHLTAIESIRPHASHRHNAPKEDRKPKREYDLGTMGVVLHMAGDLINNTGVIIVGAVIWKTSFQGRFYLDPAVGVLISIMIFISSIPLVRQSGVILLQSVPKGVDPVDVKHDIEQIAGVLAVHELHIWRLNQEKSLASAHIVTDEDAMSSFMNIANTINECLHAYGIHSATLQPEFTPPASVISQTEADDRASSAVRSRVTTTGACLVGCQTAQCEQLSCCD